LRKGVQTLYFDGSGILLTAEESELGARSLRLHIPDRGTFDKTNNKGELLWMEPSTDPNLNESAGSDCRITATLPLELERIILGLGPWINPARVGEWFLRCFL
jgi:hypothetical protein